MTVKICPECDTENPASEEICIECAFPLDDVSEHHPGSVPSSNAGNGIDDDPAGSALISPPPLGSTTVDAPECPRCGEINPPKSKFCDRCGQRLIGLMPGDTPVSGTPRDLAPPPPLDTDSADLTPPPPPPLTPLPDDLPAPPPLPVDTDEESTPAATAASHQNWKLTTIEGFHLDKQYLLYKEEMIVGRLDADSDNYPDIDLEGQDDGYVSRRHAIVRVNNGRVTVEDVGTENGTILGGRRIPPNKPFPLESGEVVRFGKVGLQLMAQIAQ